MYTSFTSSPEPDFGSGGLSPQEKSDAKRRKIRKGTRSCWECKRRKIRCAYERSEDAICVGCQRRGTTCVSQEFPEEHSQAAGRARYMGDRIVRVEALVEQLVMKVGNGAGRAGGPGRKGPSGKGMASGSPPSDSMGDRNGSSIGIPTPDESSSESARLYSVIGSSADGLDPESITVSDSNSSVSMNDNPSAESRLNLLVSTPLAGKHERISKALHAALPSQDDALALCGYAGGAVLHFKQLMTRPYEYLSNGGFETPAMTAQLPPSNVHPVLLAKKLLMLSVSLQQVDPDFYSTLGLYRTEGLSQRQAESRMADAAIRLVTSNDELIGSTDGLECVVFESVYHGNSGNLRRSWLTMRRAMVIAQLMGIHKGAGNHPPLKVIDPTRRRIFPSHTWFRIVFADRFLSLMLGLPQGSLDRTMASEEALAGDTAMGRLERLNIVIASRILERNESGASLAESLAVTHQIDLELQRVAKLMPAKWWLAPNIAAVAHNPEAVFHATIQLLNQIFHNSMLIYLHLPYMLRFAPSSSDQQQQQQQQHINHSKFEYSKMACVNASREVLARFITFRSVNHIAFCCRSIDFFALTAAMTLILAHLDSRAVTGKPTELAQQQQQQPETVQLNYSASFLAHSRLGDRAMMEQVLENMDEVSRMSADVVSRKCSEVLRRLLEIEAQASEGTAGYTTLTDDGAGGVGVAQHINVIGDVDAEGEDEEDYCGGCSSGSGQKESGVLRMSIPYFGTIKIERGGTISKEVSVASTSGTREYVDVAPPAPTPAAESVQSGQQQLSRYPSYNTSFPPTQSPQRQRQQSPPVLTSLILENAQQQQQQQRNNLFANDMSSLLSGGQNQGAAAQQPGQQAQPVDVAVPGLPSSPFSTSFVDETVRQNMAYPGLTAGTDDWALQGVDMAFFDSLMRGAPGYEMGEGNEAMW